WIVESILVVFLNDVNLLQAMIGRRQILSSMIILCLFMIFASHAQYVVDQRKWRKKSSDRLARKNSGCWK
ncbi:MAG: hypothetical protein HC887_12070, partial [Desulfobacteraceae bacterium]|nr:hypothetical protein [Desulfobacteraceae bacterium]